MFFNSSLGTYSQKAHADYSKEQKPQVPYNKKLQCILCLCKQKTIINLCFFNSIKLECIIIEFKKSTQHYTFLLDFQLHHMLIFLNSFPKSTLILQTLSEVLTPNHEQWGVECTSVQ